MGCRFVRPGSISHGYHFPRLREHVEALRQGLLASATCGCSIKTMILEDDDDDDDDDDEEYGSSSGDCRGSVLGV